LTGGFPELSVIGTGAGGVARKEPLPLEPANGKSRPARALIFLGFAAMMSSRTTKFLIMSSESKVLTRDVEASVVPIGTKVTLQKGETAHITQSLGGSYTVVVNGNMFRIADKDADALGVEVKTAVKAVQAPLGPVSAEQLEKQVWESLKSCYDPEIPVNIVDLGLIYDCHLTPLGANNYKAEVKMTLTAPGCGMGPVLAQDVQNKLISLEPIDEANVELVWDPPWNQSMMTEAAKLQLGLL
jgi:probable FeS assembly SUF system protein SufT